MTKNTSISVRRMTEADLECVLRWRNHPGVRRFMLTQHEITVDEHRDWFERAHQDETRAQLILEDRDQALGCVIFSGVRINSTAEWSFYSAPESPVGTGTRICATALNFAFREFGIHKVTGYVLDFNQASIRIHQRLGFKKEGNLREHILISDKYHDLRCFGLLYSEWLSINKDVNNH